MDAVAEEQNKSTKDWMSLEGGVSFEQGSGVGVFHKGNRTAASLVAMIINRQRNNVILLP